ncbi:elongation factor 2-like [Aristolochia californica]|uniref:elongation factor 2-like n=1 Tax=Aristolochia californica TaxID=171875 RepID=UPI0035DA8D2E
MKLSVSPILRVVVQCKVTLDLPKGVEGLKWLAKSDSMVVSTIEGSGEHSVARAEELHLEICLKNLLDDFRGGVANIVSPLLKKSCSTVMSKSPTTHNPLYMEARPMELCTLPLNPNIGKMLLMGCIFQALILH